ncbi:class II aldolase/adducin family protein [uncultured Sphaerochaeta sp.]|uniref:class II aldolase/adducin family protein n=1 Tax=uncultured Sphaerochaeta sp. TaxID=886478 RepID=UPI002A0A417D|nr:class II aldolase/adducin family protein [uncultured Sphaerochaeta sp.]
MYTEFIAAKNDFLFTARRTYASGIQTGTGGNLSSRIPGTELMIVKPSGYTYGDCCEENLTITDFSGKLVEGSYKPTRESTLHGGLYSQFIAVGGIVHTHSPYAILCSLSFSQIELCTMHSALKLKKPIPIIDVETQAVEASEIHKVYEEFEKNPELSAFILKGHGIVAVGSSARKAGQIAELIEETAEIFWKSQNK